MYLVTVAFLCSCFQRSGYDQEQQFSTIEEAEERAEEMVEDMNESFCGVHTFSAMTSGNTITITGK
jgi:hypothetical protein